MLKQFVCGLAFAFLMNNVFAQSLPTTPTVLQVVEQTIIVNGKPAKVFNIVQPDGTEGYTGIKGQMFDVTVENKTSVPTCIHWHGLLMPNDQDGVPYVTQLPIPPGGSYHYHYLLNEAGTFWMHSHYKLQEQQLLAAPFIVQDPKDPYANDKDVVVMFEDFTFKDPNAILKSLQSDSNMMMNMPMQTMDLNDVDYDAFLANRRTLQNPEIIRVTPGEKVRLRLINGCASSNMWVNTGQLKGTVIATDGQPTKPFTAHQFDLALAQRLDVEVTIPKGEGAYPILGLPEGTRAQTGIILATTNAKIPQMSEKTAAVAPAVNNVQEMKMHALNPLPAKRIDQTLTYDLAGNMQTYVWTINGEVWPHVKPLQIKQGERVAMVFINKTTMSHPMHLHGHVFEIIAINGKPIQDGVLRDTVLVMPRSTMKVIFDADNPGIWMMHCHVLYHLATGMMTTIEYVGYPKPDYYQNLIGPKRNNNS